MRRSGACDDGSIWHVVDHHGSRSDYRPFAHGYTGPNKGVAANPGSVADGYGGRQQGQVRLAVIVTAGAQVGPMRNKNIGPDGDFAQAVYLDSPAKGGPIPDFELPGIKNIGRWVNPHLPPDFRPE